MAEPPFKSNVDRREFLNGQWTGPPAEQMGAACEIASILVQAKPERVHAAKCAIESLPGAQVYSLDPKGKIVVVVEALDVGSIGTILNSISLMPDVLTAALIFHGTDEG